LRDEIGEILIMVEYFNMFIVVLYHTCVSLKKGEKKCSTGKVKFCSGGIQALLLKNRSGGKGHVH